MAIVDATIKPARWEVDGGVDFPHMAIGHLYFDSMDAVGAGMGNAVGALADVPNLTNADAAMQVSEIVA